MRALKPCTVYIPLPTFQVVQEKIRLLLDQYLDSALATLPDRGNLAVLTQHYSHLVSLGVKVAVGAGLEDVLFGRMWKTFSEDGVAKGG